MPRIKTLNIKLTCSRILSGFIAIWVSGCAYTDQFANLAFAEPHSILTADPGDNWRDSGPGVFSINSKPTSFWRTTESFRIPPGAITLNIIANQEPYEFAPLSFNAVAGQHYHLRYGNARASVALFDVTDNNKATLIKTSIRDTKKANPKDSFSSEPKRSMRAIGC